MRPAKTARRGDGWPWPQVVGAVALVVLGACGVAVLVTPLRSNDTRGTSASLLSRPNWVLATALPTTGDIPDDWGYSVIGRLQRANPASADPSNVQPIPGPAATYAPPACASIPKVLDHSGGALTAFVRLDQYVQVFGQDATPADAAATGEDTEHGPNARFAIWAVPDGPDRIANYLDWLNQCGSYHVTNYFLDGRVKDERNVTTEVEARSAAGADAAVAVTRTFSTEESQDLSSIYHVAYYAVRGVLVECTIFMEGADLALVKRLANHTLEELRAL